MAYGDPGDLFVCHHCDNPACVRPAHLFLGTHKENMEDCSRKGRAGVPKGKAPRGERNAHSKLTESDVLEIRRLYAEEGVIQTELSKQFNVKQSHISAVILRRVWKHLP